MNAKNFCCLSNCFTLLLVASIAAVQSANAAPVVTFTAWDGSDANSGIGTFGQGAPTDRGLAVNWNFPTTTVNGVTFVSSPLSSGFAPGPSQPSGGQTGGSISSPVTGTVNGIGYSLSGVDSAVINNPNDHFTGSSNALATNFFYSGAQANGISTAVETLTLTGLSPNTNYEFTSYISQWQNGDARAQNFTDSLGGSLHFDEDTNKASLFKDLYNTGANTSVTFTFTADPNGVNGNGSMHEYAFSNFSVTPEPSSFILCGLGAAGLFVAARRRRKV